MSAVIHQAQERAAWAWQAINDALRELGNKKTDYGLLVKKLPSWLQVSGLGQTMAFLFSKSKKPAYKKLFDQLSRRLITTLRARSRAEGMEVVTGLAPAEYRRASYEMMRSAELLKRFADGQIDTEGAELGEDR